MFGPAVHSSVLGYDSSLCFRHNTNGSDVYASRAFREGTVVHRYSKYALPTVALARELYTSARWLDWHSLEYIDWQTDAGQHRRAPELLLSR